MIYLDNAATSLLKPACVSEAVIKAMSSLGNAGRGVHEASLTAARTVFDARLNLAAFFGAESPQQIVFTANATEGLNIAIKGLLSPGDHVVTTMLEHNSVLRPLYEMQERGVLLDFAPCGPLGTVDYEAMEELISDHTRAVVCTHASNLTGNPVDLARISQMAKAHGSLLIVDASQTAGIFPIDVQALGIDVLCFTGHKSLLGPQGTGGMYVREGLKVRPLLSGGSGIQSDSKKHPEEMPTALEAGTLNGHGIAGLNAAIGYINRCGTDAIRQKALHLMRRFCDGVKDIPGIRIYGDFSSEERCPIVALNLKDFDSSQISDELYMTYGISTRPGAHCAPLMHEVLGTKKQGAVRFSFSHLNTEEEIDDAVKALYMIEADFR